MCSPQDRLVDFETRMLRRIGYLVPAGGGHKARRAAPAYGAATTTRGEPPAAHRAAARAQADGRTQMIASSFRVRGDVA